MLQVGRLLMLVMVVLAGRAWAQDTPELVLRHGEPAPSGQIRVVSVDGVVVGSSVASPVIVGWDRIKSVHGPYAEEAQAYLHNADQLWRAESRLARGDAAAAEPIFEQLFEIYRTRQGPTAAAVCKGLLRCRLRRNAQTLAVDAWLAWLHARDSNDGPLWYQSRSGQTDAFDIDQTTGLLPQLPPIWLDLPAVRVFANRSKMGADQMGSQQSDLASLYEYAAALATGRVAHDDQMPYISSHASGVLLVADIVQAQSLDAQQRQAGRQAIIDRLKDVQGGWLAAWLETALGRSLLLENDLEQQQRGVIELLRVRVLRQVDSPYLAGLALAQAAVALKHMGKTDAADLLRQELLDAFPGHPATTWDEIDIWPSHQQGNQAAGVSHRSYTAVQQRHAFTGKQDS